MNSLKRHSKILLVVFVCLAHFLASRLQAETYYIDFDDGLTTNTGSRTSPWKHCPGDPNAVGIARDHVPEAGDTFRFKGGVVYLGYVEIKSSGTSGSLIVYDGNAEGHLDGAWGTGKAIIDGQGEELGINARKYGFYSPNKYFGPGDSHGVSHVLIDNFEIRNLLYISGASMGIVIDGPGFGIEIRNCYIHDVFKNPHALVVEKDTTGTVMTSTTFRHTGRDFSSYTGTPGQVATHKILIGWSRLDYNQTSGYMVPTEAPDTFTVYKDIYMTEPGWEYNPTRVPFGNDGKYFYRIYNLQQGYWNNTGGMGIRVQSHSDVYIHHNTIQNAKQSINIYTYAQDSNINIFSNDISEAIWGIYISTAKYEGVTISGIKVYDNLIHDFYPFAKDAYGGHQDSVFMVGYADGLSDIEVYNNFFYGDFRGAITSVTTFSRMISNLKIHNNVFASFAGKNSYILLERRGYVMENVKIYNNTFARVPGSQRKCFILNELTSLTLANNLFYYFEGYGSTFSVPPFTTTGFFSDYNLLTARDSAAQLRFDDEKYTLANWVARGDFDQNSILLVDPLFRNFPKFTATVSTNGTKTQIYYATVPVDYPIHDFAANDFIEYEYDGVPRKIKSVNAAEGYIVLYSNSDALQHNELPQNSKTGERLLNWKTSSNFTLDLRLQAGSPAINAGKDLSSEITILDIDGFSRLQDGSWDIGAYEYTFSPPPLPEADVSPPPPPEADVSPLAPKNLHANPENVHETPLCIPN